MYNQDDPELVVRKAKTVKLHVGDLNFTHKHLAAVSKRFFVVPFSCMGQL